MNTIIKVIVATLILVAGPLFAKETKSTDTTLIEALKAYTDIQLSGDLAQSLDYVYPPVFTVTPKEMLEQSFKMAKESGKMPKVIAFNVENNQPLKKYDKGMYVILPYTMEMNMDLTPPVSKENKEEYAKVEEMLNDPKKIEAYKEFTLNMLKMTMGKGAEINSKEGSLLIDIKKSSKILAINENKSGWKFVEADAQAIAPVKSVIPKEIVENEKEIFSAKVLTQEEQMQQMMEMMSK
jgi:hypothetical protein